MTGECKVAWTVVSAVFIAAVGALYVGSAAQAPTSPGFGARDLEILRQWISTGHLSPLAYAPDHLLKPGYIVYLRTILGSREPFPIRRLLVINALAMVCSFAVVCIALWRSGLRRSAGIAAACFLAYVPLRDATDHALSEPVAAAGILLCLTFLIVGIKRRPLLALAGILAGLLALIRPNVFEVFIVLALLVVASARHERLVSVVLILAGFLSTCAAVTLVGKWRSIPLNPFGIAASTPFLWGAADYYWEPDIGPWPSGATAAKKGRTEIREAANQWKTRLRRWSADDRRALLWKVGHAFFSCEQLPARWRPAWYITYDKAIRRWWWVAALGFAGLSAAIAVGGAGHWRFAPALLVAAIDAQGLLFGADPRFTLPFIPALFVLLVLAAPGLRFSPRTLVSAMAVIAFGLALISATPDVTNSDFGVLRGSQSLEFEIPARAFPKNGDRATLHFRILEETQRFDRGMIIEGDGQPLGRYDPDPPRPQPAFLSAVIVEPLLSNSRRKGIMIRLRAFGGPSSGFFYFPVVPRPWGKPVSIDGRATFESGYGGTTGGGIPFWVHGGIDSP